MVEDAAGRPSLCVSSSALLANVHGDLDHQKLASQPQGPVLGSWHGAPAGAGAVRRRR